MARGTPVIAINSGGPMESVKYEKNEKSGFLIEKDPKKWAKEMLSLSKDQSCRAEISEFAKKWAFEQFSLASMSSKLKEDLEKLSP